MQAAAKELLGFLTRHSLGLVGDRRARGARWLLERARTCPPPLSVYCTHEAEGRCDRVGTRCDDDVVRCDEHAWPRLQTLSYAPALRRLRALTKEEG